MNYFLVALSYVMILALGIGIGLSVTTKDFVKVIAKLEETLDKNIEQAGIVDEDFDYSKYLDQDGKFFTTKHIRSDDE